MLPSPSPTLPHPPPQTTQPPRPQSLFSIRPNHAHRAGLIFDEAAKDLGQVTAAARARKRKLMTQQSPQTKLAPVAHVQLSVSNTVG